MRGEDHLDLKHIAVGFDLIEIHPHQTFPMKEPKAACGILDRKVEDARRVDAVGPPAKPLPQNPPPFIHAAAWHIARAKHDVMLPRRFQHLRDVLRLMGKIGVHLDQNIRAQRQSPSEAVSIRRPQALFFRAVQHKNFSLKSILPRQVFGNVASAVGRIVIHNQHMKIGDAQSKQRGDNFADVFAFVIGWQDDHHFEGHKDLAALNRPAER